jgi:translation initiation factor 2B subunit (eIF-2B alpha/beta/delta family)
VAPLRADVVNGAAAIGRTAVGVVREAVLATQAPDSQAFRRHLVKLSGAILDSQPAMAPLVTLTSLLLNACREDDPLPQAKDAVLRATGSFQEAMERAASAVAESAEPLLPGGSTLLTLSASSTVRAVLERWGRERRIRVICLESRPQREGLLLARELAREGLDVSVAVDAAAGRLMGEADLVLLGADSVGDQGVVNKIGSRSLVSLARGQKVPVHLLMDRSKFLPPHFPQPVEDARPGQEIMEAAEGVRIWNQYFELFAVDSVASIVTEDGITSPAQVEEIRSGIVVPLELREWAQARSQ